LKDSVFGGNGPLQPKKVTPHWSSQNIPLFDCKGVPNFGKEEGVIIEEGSGEDNS